MDDKNQLQYDVQKRARAGTRATFRAVVSLYLIYLGYSVLKSTIHGESTLPDWLGWIAGIFFIAAALGFGVFIYKSYRKDLADAKLTPPEEQLTELPPEESPKDSEP